MNYCRSCFEGVAIGWKQCFCLYVYSRAQARVARGAVAPLVALFAADTFQGSSSINAEAGEGSGDFWVPNQRLMAFQYCTEMCLNFKIEQK